MSFKARLSALLVLIFVQLRSGFRVGSARARRNAAPDGPHRFQRGHNAELDRRCGARGYATDGVGQIVAARP